MQDFTLFCKIFQVLNKIFINFNILIFRYNRRWNLELICKSLQEDFNISSNIDSKDNIIIEEMYKVSVL